MHHIDLRGHSVLVVEREPLIAVDLCAALEDAGAEVIRAASATEALRLAKRRAVSAAVLDLQPGSNEHRPLARHLQREGVPFLFYSTHHPEDVPTVRDIPVILKPTAGDKIVSALAVMLGLAQSP